jgi:hypothetical protein
MKKMRPYDTDADLDLLQTNLIATRLALSFSRETGIGIGLVGGYLNNAREALEKNGIIPPDNLEAIIYDLLN